MLNICYSQILYYAYTYIAHPSSFTVLTLYKCSTLKIWFHILEVYEEEMVMKWWWRCSNISGVNVVLTNHNVFMSDLPMRHNLWSGLLPVENKNCFFWYTLQFLTINYRWFSFINFLVTLFLFHSLPLSCRRLSLLKDKGSGGEREWGIQFFPRRRSDRGLQGRWNRMRSGKGTGVERGGEETSPSPAPLPNPLFSPSAEGKIKRQRREVVEMFDSTTETRSW